MRAGNAKTLAALKIGEEAKVRSIDGGSASVNRLQSMGIIPGTDIKIIQASLSGPIIIEARGSRVAIGRGMTSKIIVENV